MDKYQILGIISQVVTVGSAIPYILGIIRGVIVPNRVTWAIWSVVGITLWFTTWANPNSDSITVMFAFILAFNPTVVFILTFWKGSTEPISKMEKAAILIATSAIATWLFTKNNPGILPTLFAILADICALVPTIRFVNNNPDQDRPTAWILFMIGSILAISGVKLWNMDSLILPIYMTIGSFFIVIHWYIIGLKIKPHYANGFKK
ncbi:hypothetical protein M0P65_01545 [Candidatus Gracilibacteria bacterium]|nr:hypothetical protein [Candidatus Gracilibacteria bacterium]